MPGLDKSSTKHHCPLDGKGKGKCCWNNRCCTTHQTTCPLHPRWAHLKTEEFPKCVVSLPKALRYVTPKLTLEPFSAPRRLRLKIQRTTALVPQPSPNPQPSLEPPPSLKSSLEPQTERFMLLSLRMPDSTYSLHVSRPTHKAGGAYNCDLIM